MIGRNHHANDSLLLADSYESLQRIVNLVAKRSASYGLRMNIIKTKVIVFSKELEKITFEINNKKVE